MSRPRRLALFVVISFVLLALCPAASWGGILSQFVLDNHPDAQFHAPSYGLRLDHLFKDASLGGAGGGVTTFSMEGVVLTVADTATGLQINLNGPVYGGEDAGEEYGFGEGEYTIDFTYAVNVMEADGGWQAAPISVSNNGTLTAGEGIEGVSEGMVFEFYELIEHGMPFMFKPDGHRLEADRTSWVGRGWLTTRPDGNLRSEGQDFIFTELPPLGFPEPHGVLIWAGGLLAVMVQRRVRSLGR